MRVTRLVAMLALCAGGCTPSTLPSQPPGDPGGDPAPGDTDPGTDPGPGTDSDPSGDTDPVTDQDPTLVPEYGLCATTPQCEPGLECTPWPPRDYSYCMKPCVADSDCGSGRACTSGYCTNEVHWYEPLDQFSDCGLDSIPLKSISSGSPHCAPICDLGTLTGYELNPYAPACPPLPSWLHGTAPTCVDVAITVGGDHAGVCVTEVDIGQICDQAALRCNYLGTRADTDPTHEATGNDPDPGAPWCLTDPTGVPRCLRVCSIDSGATTSPCACPPDDGCTDPTDGLAWGCEGWSPYYVATNLRACFPVEDCTADPTVCADNLASGLVTCKPTQFTAPSPADTCQ